MELARIVSDAFGVGWRQAVLMTDRLTRSRRGGVRFLFELKNASRRHRVKRWLLQSQTPQSDITTRTPLKNYLIARNSRLTAPSLSVSTTINPGFNRV